MTVTSKIGFGRKVEGEIAVLGTSRKGIDSRDLSAELSGKIVVFLSWVPREYLEKLSFLGVVGMAVPSMHFRDFNYFSQDGGFSLVVLMKFGQVDLPEELVKKLAGLAGKKGVLDGEEKTLICS